MKAAHRTRLAKDETGIKYGEAPTRMQFEARFMRAIETRCAEKPGTVDFYRRMFKGLVAFAPLANARLDRVDEALIEGFVHDRDQHVSKTMKERSIEKVSRATVNRHLATLRRALRLAQEWKIINRVPRIRLLAGEVVREFVLRRDDEAKYLENCPQPLRDAAVLMLDTGLRVGEALALCRDNVHLEPGDGKKFGFVHVQKGKTKIARRAVSLTGRATEMLRQRKQEAINDLVFPGGSIEGPFLASSLSHQHSAVRVSMGLPKEFVVHSLRHSMLTRMGEAGADAFTIMRIAGHSSVLVSQRYVHPSDDAMESASEKFGALLGHSKMWQAEHPSNSSKTL